MIPIGDVDYIAVKTKKPLWIAIILILIFFTTLQILITIKCLIWTIGLNKENEDLKKVIEAQNSMMADIQEDNINLQKMLEE